MTEDIKIKLAVRKQELLNMLQAGELKELFIYPSMTVQDAFIKDGKQYPAINYTPCFAYTDKFGNRFIEDVPQRDETHRVLRTMFEYCYMHLTIKDIQ